MRISSKTLFIHISLMILNFLYTFEDLGITFNDNMSFNTHINTIYNKAHLIINRLFKCFITNDYIYLLKAYLSYVDLLLNRIHLFRIQTISYAILTI